MLKLIVRHLEIVECLYGQDVELCPAVDEGPGDSHVADDWGAEHPEGACGSHTLELICRTEGDGALGPPERARGLELGEDCIHLTSELFEVAL